MLVRLRFAVAAVNWLVRPCAVVMALIGMVFVYMPGPAVTSTPIVQLAPAASVVTEVVSLNTIWVGVDTFNEAKPPGQVVVAFGTAAIVTPTGRVSVKLILLIGTSNGAVMVMVKWLVLPVVDAGEKAFLTSTGS